MPKSKSGTSTRFRLLELSFEYPIAASPLQVWEVMTERATDWWRKAEFFSRPDAVACHLNNLSMLTGRPFTWDPVTEQSDSDEVNALLTPKMRAPWTL